jgi:hypothetical protein
MEAVKSFLNSCVVVNVGDITKEAVVRRPFAREGRSRQRKYRNSEAFSFFEEI